jgi:methionyl-tRNA formyltransferase
MRYVFMGSPPFAVPVLEKLLESGHEALALVTRPDRPRGRGREISESPLVQLARERGVLVNQPSTTRDPEFVASLRRLEPDVILVASYGEILREEILGLAPHGALNVHGSLLPRHRGAAPVQAAIAAGDRRTGVSVQRIVLALDEGDVLLEKSIEIAERETAGELFDRLAQLGAAAALEALDRLQDGTATFTPQNPELATYARKLKKEDGRIDWTRPQNELERHVRAMTPWPGARTTTPSGKEIVVVEAREIAEQSGGAGEVLETKKRCVVACGEGALELLFVQPAGKRPMEATAWLRGAHITRGNRLGGGGNS